MCVILFHLYITMYLHLHTTYIYQLFWIFEHIISLVSFAGIISELKAFLSRHDLGSYIKWKIEKYIAKIPIFSYQTLDSAPLIDNGWWFSNCNNLWLKPMETLPKFAAAAIVQIEVSLLSRVECCRCCWDEDNSPMLFCPRLTGLGTSSHPWAKAICESIWNFVQFRYY